MGLIQTFAVVFDVSLAISWPVWIHGDVEHAVREVLNVTLPRVGALLPFLMLVLNPGVRPRADGDARYMTMLRRHWPWILRSSSCSRSRSCSTTGAKGRHSAFVLTLMSEIA